MSETYLLVRRNGMIQRHRATVEGKTIIAWPVAQTHSDAVVLCRWFGDAEVVGPALIGDVEGETLEGHIQQAIEDGCAAICCVTGWQDDGSPVWSWREIGK